MKNLAIIPARSGSKGIIDKNRRELNGKPLIAYSILAALRSEMFDTVMVSTDSEAYAEIAREYGAEVPFLRSAENSTDQAKSESVILEVLAGYEKIGRQYDTFMLLQPTSPLRTETHIREAYKAYEEKNAKAVVSVCEVDHSPLYCNTLPKNLSLDGFLSGNLMRSRRQDLDTYYRLNGAIYISDVSEYKQTKNFYRQDSYAYIMSKADSVDIDDELDLLVAETLLNRRGFAK